MVMQLHYHVNIVYVQCVSTISGPYYDEQSLRGAWPGAPRAAIPILGFTVKAGRKPLILAVQNCTLS